MRNILFLLILLPFLSIAQLNESFSDGDFTTNPVWSGDNASFKISTYSSSTWSTYPRLQLNGTAADTSYLKTDCVLPSLDNVEWNFWVRLAFNTSKTNNCRVYLASDKADLTASLNGYFVLFGDDTDDQTDSISLCRQTGTAYQKIIRGSITATNASANYRIKVIRDSSGKWTLYCDNTGGINFIPEGSCSDNTYNSASFFGIFCKYTSTNKTNFYIDDIYAGPVIVDKTPPSVVSAELTSTSSLDVLFSEPVSTATAENITHYIVDKGIGNPLVATKDTKNGKLIHLSFANTFEQKASYTLSISNVEDLSGNIMTPVNKLFTLYVAAAYEVQINEIMADPDPAIDLPVYEYVELYNRTQYPINLKDWELRTGSSIKPLPNTIIMPDDYLIITTVSGATPLSIYGTTVGLEGFSLSNTGTSVILYDSLNRMISGVEYTDEWYRDSYKKNGGWSLEQIDPLNPCGGKTNWKASVSYKGGTPGKVNSVKASNPDLEKPELVRVSIIDTNIVEAFFSEILDSTYLKNVANYFINNGIGIPLSASPTAPFYTSVKLLLPSSVKTGVIYNLTIADTLTDCAGNIVPVSGYARFAIPQPAAKNDLVINEILANPTTECVDFVEIYNRSPKVIDIRDMVLSVYDTNTLVLDEIKDISAGSYLVFPEDYVVLTTNPDIVKSCYTALNPKNFIQMTSFPGFNNDDGTVAIAAKSNYEIIDKFAYSSDMYMALLNATDGVSLERVNYNRPSDDKTNWHCASEKSGFGTPSYKNSQYSEGVASADPVSLSPELFSPDNDGNNDVLNINYTFETPGYIANIVIYDASGRLIRNLIINTLLGTSGTFSWNGITDDNEKASTGIYIIYLEVFDLKGNVKHYKKTTVLAGKQK